MSPPLSRAPSPLSFSPRPSIFSFDHLLGRLTPQDVALLRPWPWSSGTRTSPAQGRASVCWPTRPPEPLPSFLARAGARARAAPAIATSFSQRTGGPHVALLLLVLQATPPSFSFFPLCPGPASRASVRTSVRCGRGARGGELALAAPLASRATSFELERRARDRSLLSVRETTKGGRSGAVGRSRSVERRRAGLDRVKTGLFRLARRLASRARRGPFDQLAPVGGVG